MTSTQTQIETIASAPTIAICPHACAWGDIEIIPAKDFLKYFNKKIAGKDTSYCEVYQNGALVKPFFDFEKEYLQQPSDTEINTQYTMCIDNILDLFDGMNINKEDIAVAQRHRWALGKETDKKDKNIFKVSFHLFVQGISMKHTDIKYIIEFKKQGDFWDTSVYSNRRMFYMIDTVKLGEQGVMTPMTHSNNPLAFVGQYIEGTEQMEVDKEKYNAVINDDIPVLPEPEDETIQKLQKILREELGDKHSRHDRGFRFSTNKNKGRVCPCSGETHYSNGFYLQPCENGDVMYVCQAKHEGAVNTKTKIVGNLNIPKGQCILEDDDDDGGKRPLPEDKQMINLIEKLLGNSAKNSRKSGVHFESRTNNIYHFTNDSGLGMVCPCGGEHYQGGFDVVADDNSSLLYNCKVDIHSSFETQELGEWYSNPEKRKGDMQPYLEKLAKHPKLLWVWEFINKMGTLQDIDYGEIAHYLLKDDIKYVPSMSKSVFYYWNENETLWIECKDCLVRKMIGVTLFKTINELCDVFDNRLCFIGHIATFLKDLKDKGKCDNILKMCYEDFLDAEFEDRLDSNSNLIGCVNGVVELDKKLVRPRKKDDYIMRLAKASYIPSKDTSRFHSILLAILKDDEEMVKYFRKLLGYGMTGEVCEELFVIWKGSGRNGKGLTTNIIMEVLKDFCCQLETGLIVERQTHFNEEVQKAKLYKKRFAFVNELKDTEKVKTDEIKRLTGGDPVSCKRLFKDARDFNPNHQLIASTNHLPVLDPDHAFVERLIIIPFDVLFKALREGETETLTVRRVDDTLKALVRTEDFRDEVFSYLVESAYMWYCDRDLKTNKPPIVRLYAEKYFEDCDMIQKFIDEECETGETSENLKENAISMYDAYVRTSGDRMDRRVFNDKMKNKGYKKKSIRDGENFFMGFSGIQVRRTKCSIAENPLDKF